MTLFLFAGDSVTDCGRTFFDADVAAGQLGDGWVRIVASLVGHREPGGHRFLNAGVSGDRVADLLARWDDDVARVAPEVLTILVGVNDALLEPPTPVDRFAEGYTALLDAVPASVDRLVLAEPFVVPATDGARELRRLFEPHLECVRSLAGSTHATVLPLDRLFAEACERADPSWWAPDGVHPSPAGHGLIAQAWLEAVISRR